MAATLTDLWGLLTPPDPAIIDIAPGRRAEHRAVSAVSRLAPGSGVVLRGTQDAVLRVARDAHVDITRELIPLPTSRHPVYLVEDDDVSVRRLFDDLVSVPPGVNRLAAPADAVLRLAVRLAPLQPFRRLFPWRVAVGRRR